MNRNVLIVLAGGFLIAVLVALLVQAALKGGNQQPAPVTVKEEPRVEIIVAATDIKIGAALSDTNIKWQQWPEKAVFPGAVVRKGDQKVGDAIEGRVSRDFKAGEPVLKTALVDDRGANLTGILEAGMRAYTVPVSATTMVAGFAGPGDYVDVLLTYRTRIDYDGVDSPGIERTLQSNINNRVTETILQNIKILAVDQHARKAAASSGDSKRSSDDPSGVRVGKNITFEVTPKEAETLAIATGMGELSLTLRGVGDDVIRTEKEPVTTDARITKAYQEIVRELDRAAHEAGQNAKVIRVYRGGVVEDVAVTQ